MRKRTKVMLGLGALILAIYGVTFIFAKDVFEILVPFFEWPRDCGIGCKGKGA